jgi:hypothetical protein
LDDNETGPEGEMSDYPIKRIGGAGRRSQRKCDSLTRTLLLVGGVAAAFVSIVSAAAIGYMLNRKRN